MNEFWKFLWLGNSAWDFFPRGRHSLIWPIRVCAAEQGTVFKVLSLKLGIQFHH